MIKTAAKKKFRMLGVALVSLSQAYSEPREIIKTKICGKVKKGFQTLTIFAKKNSIIGICSEHAYVYPKPLAAFLVFSHRLQPLLLTVTIVVIAGKIYLNSIVR